MNRFQACGKDIAEVERDSSRVRYLSPPEAVEYGLIDKVLYPDDIVAGQVSSKTAVTSPCLSLTLYCRFDFLGAEVY